MKVMSENEKQQLIKQKEAITMELETHKFTEVKEQERFVISILLYLSIQ